MESTSRFMKQFFDNSRHEGKRLGRFEGSKIQLQIGHGFTRITRIEPSNHLKNSEREAGRARTPVPPNAYAPRQGVVNLIGVHRCESVDLKLKQIPWQLCEV
jgi:hypothetical protein